MTITETDLPGVLLVSPKAYGDSRGYFFESYNRQRYRDAGIDCDFVQDNVSFSTAGVIRGLHYQLPNEQAKLLSVVSGAILDVAVDIRKDSPYYGKWVGAVLSSENHHQLFIPTGFAHGFAVIGSHAVVAYKCSGTYDPKGEVTVKWDDPEIGIKWGTENAIISDRDQAGVLLKDVSQDRLPD